MNEDVFEEVMFFMRQLEKENISNAYFHRNKNTGDFELSIVLKDVPFSLVENVDIEEK